ncbi:N-acetylneuraminate synthase family protein [Chloroflexota bacterium]
MRQIKIGQKLVGDGCPVLIIAEVGINYDNDFEKAHRLIDLAVDAGVDVIKFQTFTADGLVSRKGSNRQWELHKQYELPYERHAELKKHVEQQGCVFLSTPSDERDVDFLEKLGVVAFKLGSDDSTNYPFLKYVAQKGLPMIVATGLCTIGDVYEAVSTVRRTGNEDLIILQCTTSYPAHPQYANLRTMKAMSESLQVPVGYSDHIIGINVVTAAVALGAVVIEKHFTYDKNASGPDHSLSADPAELQAMVQAIREAEQALGSPFKQPTEIEREALISFRKSVIATQDIAAGSIITDKMVVPKRPGTGIPAREIDLVIGRTARRSIECDEVITWGDI